MGPWFPGRARVLPLYESQLGDAGAERQVRQPVPAVPIRHPAGGSPRTRRPRCGTGDHSRQAPVKNLLTRWLLVRRPGHRRLSDGLPATSLGDLSQLADAVLLLIRTRADGWRWNIANVHGEQMHDAAVDLLKMGKLAAGSEEAAGVDALIAALWETYRHRPRLQLEFDRAGPSYASTARSRQG